MTVITVITATGAAAVDEVIDRKPLSFLCKEETLKNVLEVDGKKNVLR
jgi:hypothetical protein